MAQTQEDKLKKIDGDTNKALSPYFIKISIKGIDLTPSTVFSMIIREHYSYLVPRISLSLMDTGIFLDNFPLEEDDEIVIQLGTNKEEPSLQATFLVDSFNIGNAGGGNDRYVIVDISGILKTTNLLKPILTRSFGSIKSSDLISDLASEIGLKSDVRVTSRDAMKWLQVNSTTYNFIRILLRDPL